MTGFVFAGCRSVRGCLDTVNDGVAQHVFERRQHAF